MNPAPGWYPVALGKASGGDVLLSWQDLSGIQFTEPFFEDSLRRARAAGKVVHWTSPAALLGIPPPPGIGPDAFIFHASRCGSTLLTQLLGQVPGSIVMAEPPILDDVLQLPIGTGDKTTLVQKVMGWLGQRRDLADRQFFIKFDSWHLPCLSVIRQAFPSTPCWFIYRHPVEILHSHHRQRGSQMVPGLLPPSTFGLSADQIDPSDLDGYAVCVLTSVFQQAVAHASCGNLSLLSYEQFCRDPAGTVERLGVSLTPAERKTLSNRCHYHSKNPGSAYLQEAGPDVPAIVRLRLEKLAAPVLVPAFQQLEELRNVQSPHQLLTESEPEPPPLPP
jgi:hypothetical protein